MIERIWSKEAKDLQYYMIKQLSSCKYCYREFVIGCFEGGIDHYGFKKPEESQDDIVDFVIEIMKNI